MTIEFGPKNADELQSTALRLIGLIYEAAVDPDRWNEFLRVYGELYPGASQWLWLEDRERADVRILTNESCDLSFVPSYQGYYAALNPWTETMLQQPEGHIHLADWLAPRAFLEAGEFYNDWMKPQDLHDGFGASVLRFGRQFMFYSLLHTKAATTGERDLELLKLLVPHMQRAARLHGHFLGLQEQADAAATLLDRLSIGALLCEPTGRVLVMNKAAEAMVMSGDGLDLVAGRLQPARKSETDTLARLIAAAAGMIEGEAPTRTGALAIPRPSGKRDFGLIVAPYDGEAPDSPWARLAPETRVAIFVADPESRVEPRESIIARLYALTPAEADLAAAISDAVTLADYADSRGITLGTTRDRLKSVFAKTDTHSQVALARLILSGPAGMVPAAETEWPEPP